MSKLTVKAYAMGPLDPSITPFVIHINGKCTIESIVAIEEHLASFDEADYKTGVYTYECCFESMDMEVTEIDFEPQEAES